MLAAACEALGFRNGVLCSTSHVTLLYPRISGLWFIGTLQGNPVSRWTPTHFQVRCFACKRMQALKKSVDVHPCAVGLMEVRRAWNYRLCGPWKRILACDGLGILEANKIYRVFS